MSIPDAIIENIQANSIQSCDVHIAAYERTLCERFDEIQDNKKGPTFR
ncbi:hypothetical protein PMI26_03629 [Pseudomonas sp. GM33]|jgi:hypothetical protein|nr:hypothetical protein PMI26_03629 [Pseudomonas sp. GM33]MDP9657025.1 hypothetical protein [Pseudomonas putida]